jgi:selenocysteine lyase/cysteine desulfurase
VSDGADLRAEFLLDPDVTFLNHGSFCACPRAVFEGCREWQVELERQLVLFLARRLEELLADARLALGAYAGADPDDLVFVPNATAGVNVAAWSIGLEPGDEVLSTDLEYGALDLTTPTSTPETATSGSSISTNQPSGTGADTASLAPVTRMSPDACPSRLLGG